jgi:hypothetical protein
MTIRSLIVPTLIALLLIVLAIACEKNQNQQTTPPHNQMAPDGGMGSAPPGGPGSGTMR